MDPRFSACQFHPLQTRNSHLFLIAFGRTIVRTIRAAARLFGYSFGRFNRTSVPVTTVPVSVSIHFAVFPSGVTTKS